MSYFTGFTCVKCAAPYPPDRDLLLCPKCDSLLEADYDYARLARELDRDALGRRPDNVWRWRELLPVLDPTKIVTLGEGGTPLLRADRLARACGVRELWLKSDASNPTGSLKDRSMHPLHREGAHARDEPGISEITTARPIQAALTSAATFSVGAAAPLALVLLSPSTLLIPVVSAGSLLFLALLGFLGAKTGGADILRPIVRVTLWGALAMAVTAGIGAIVGAIV